jgi:hypothetical protein
MLEWWQKPDLGFVLTLELLPRTWGCPRVKLRQRRTAREIEAAWKLELLAETSNDRQRCKRGGPAPFKLF